MKRVLALALVIVVGSAVAQNAPVVKPHASAKDYQAHGENANAVIGAAQLSSKQVRKTFVSNMRKDYIVVEVGVYPKNGFTLSPANFTLRAANSDKPIAPADPKLMASQIDEKDQKGTDVAIYPYETVTYSTGGDPYDPYYGKTHGGVTTSTGVNVVTKPNRRDPKTRAGDTSAMVAELTEKSLPESEISKPVAGYIYFPVNQQESTYTLEYKSTDGTTISIPLPTPTE